MNLANPSNKGNADSGSIATMTQDILILLLPYLSSNDVNALFGFCLSKEVLSSEESGVQKRGYKILAKLIEGGVVPVADAPGVFKLLDELSESNCPAAKKVR